MPCQEGGLRRERLGYLGKKEGNVKTSIWVIRRSPFSKLSVDYR